MIGIGELQRRGVASAPGARAAERAGGGARGPPARPLRARPETHTNIRGNTYFWRRALSIIIPPSVDRTQNHCAYTHSS